jgi:hypothetical protein
MFVAHQRAQWNHTASIVSMVFNTTRNRPDDCKTAENFQPLLDLEPFDANGELVNFDALSLEEQQLYLKTQIILE